MNRIAAKFTPMKIVDYGTYAVEYSKTHISKLSSKLLLKCVKQKNELLWNSFRSSFT